MTSQLFFNSFISGLGISSANILLFGITSLVYFKYLYIFRFKKNIEQNEKVEKEEKVETVVVEEVEKVEEKVETVVENEEKEEKEEEEEEEDEENVETVETVETVVEEMPKTQYCQIISPKPKRCTFPPINDFEFLNYQKDFKKMFDMMI